MNNKLILAIATITLVAAALASVATAQFINNQTTAPPNENQAAPPYATNTGAVAQQCLNQTNGQPCSDGSYPCYCGNNTQTGFCQNQNTNCNGYGYGCAGQNQNSWSNHHGMMDRNSGNGWGCHR